MLYGAIEGGGTKFACALGRSATEILESVVIPTSGPDATLGACVSFWHRRQSHMPTDIPRPLPATGAGGPSRSCAAAAFSALANHAVAT
jgi:predicted NBD/HSP70 family sugar kinase